MILSRMVKICGCGESFRKVEERLLDLIDSQTNPTIATYAQNRRSPSIRITARASSEEE